MGLFDWLKKKNPRDDIEGTLSYIPGSTTPNQDEAITMEGGQLIKRMYIQPEARNTNEHSNIPIYTGNPFRAMTEYGSSFTI